MPEVIRAGHFDLVVVGLGAVGSAAMLHASRAGLRVLGIDRFDPPHTMGSTHAESRITRLAVGEGAQYLPFVARSHEIWRELEEATGIDLLFQPGGYIITPPAATEDRRWGGFVQRTAEVAAAANIDFEVRAPAAVVAHIDRLKLQGDERIGFEPTGGIVLCERAVEVQLRLAREAGATTIVNQPVDAVSAKGSGVEIKTGEAVYTASHVIVATGAWFGELAPAVDAAAVRVTRQVVYWFEVEDPQDFAADLFPFVIWPGHTIEEYSAVFPHVEGGRAGLKLLGEQFAETTTADEVDRTVSAGEAADFYERLVEPRLTGVSPEVLHAEVCLYTNTVDDHFLIDTEQSGRIQFASPCSGHGFKHSTALAEAMVAKVTGSEGLDLSPFARE